MSLKHIFNLIDKHMHEGAFATFDCDGSTIMTDIGEAALAYMCENQLLRTVSGDSEAYHANMLNTYYDLFKQNRALDAYVLATNIFVGYSPAEIKDIVTKTLQAEGTVLGKRTLYGRTIEQGIQIRPETKQIMEYLAQNNVTCYIVSASNRYIVEALAEHYKDELPVMKCIGVENKVENGVLTSQVLPPLCGYAGKVDNIKKYIHPTQRPLLALGDSSNDQAMLEYAKVPVAVNKNNALTAHARKMGWNLI